MGYRGIYFSFKASSVKTGGCFIVSAYLCSRANFDWLTYWAYYYISLLFEGSRTAYYLAVFSVGSRQVSAAKSIIFCGQTYWILISSVTEHQCFGGKIYLHLQGITFRYSPCLNIQTAVSCVPLIRIYKLHGVTFQETVIFRHHHENQNSQMSLMLKKLGIIIIIIIIIILLILLVKHKYPRGIGIILDNRSWIRTTCCWERRYFRSAEQLQTKVRREWLNNRGRRWCFSTRLQTYAPEWLWQTKLCERMEEDRTYHCIVLCYCCWLRSAALLLLTA
jgi:hypothetical protein